MHETPKPTQAANGEQMSQNRGDPAWRAAQARALETPATAEEAAEDIAQMIDTQVRYELAKD